MSETKPTAKAPASGAGLGTFSGVFVPSLLTILGVILFLRLGYVVGAGGLITALLIILAANSISVLTSISLAAIATNMRVRGGGDYYLISRTLGPEFGGALGLVLFLAQSVSIGFYAIGFGEVVGEILHAPSTANAQIVALAAVALLFGLAWLGANVATTFQYVVMAMLVSAIAAFLWGGWSSWRLSVFSENLESTGSTPFWALFAIFFPAVTGFTQGVSMSGDLRNPGRSLPSGTFLAVGVSAVVYVGVALVFAGAVSPAVLANDNDAMRLVSPWPWLVAAGVISATLSSALASFLGAPRILQSLARDRVIPALTLFAKGSGRVDNPRRALLLSLVIALATVLLGDLNVIAPVVSMFFLISYGLLNYATYHEASHRSPSFRPTFRHYHKALSLAGAVACLAAMVAIDPLAASVAVVIMFAVYQYLSRTVEFDRWSDSSRSHQFHVVRKHLHMLAASPEHPRDWRPVVLAMSNVDDRWPELIRFARWIEGQTGFTTAVALAPYEGALVRIRRREIEARLLSNVRALYPDVFALALAECDAVSGFSALVQAFGLGPIRANTLLVNASDCLTKQANAVGQPADNAVYAEFLQIALRLGCNLVLLASHPENLQALERAETRHPRIDIWYWSEKSGQLMLLLAHLMTRSAPWENATLRVLAPAVRRDGVRQTVEDLQQMLSDVRIAAEAKIIEQGNLAALTSHSHDAAMTFLPFRLRDHRPTSILEAPIDEVLEQLSIVVLVLAAQDIDLDAGPEQGPYEGVADLIDRASVLQRLAGRAERDFEKAEHLADEAQQQYEQLLGAGGDADELSRLMRDAEAASVELETLRRRAIRTRVKAQAAAREADAVRTELGAPKCDKDAGVPDPCGAESVDEEHQPDHRPTIAKPEAPTPQTSTPALAESAASQPVAAKGARE